MKDHYFSCIGLFAKNSHSKAFFLPTKPWSRCDRDCYVKNSRENINLQIAYNLDKQATNNLNTTENSCSIMHYDGPPVFSIQYAMDHTATHKLIMPVSTNVYIFCMFSFVHDYNDLTL